MVFVTGFTIEHISKSLAPNGRIDSAPNAFTVWVSYIFSTAFIFYSYIIFQALESETDYEAVQFGTYNFLENGTSLQYFPVQNKDIKRSYNIVELRVESNHGNANYTCLYRFRVHGKPDL